MSNASESELSPRLRQDLYEHLGRSKSAILWSGIGLAIVGAAAIVFPALATVTVTLMLGAVFVAAGLIGVYAAFSYEGTGQFFGALLLNLLKVAVGVYMFMHPGVGILALTIMAAAVFMIEGAFEISLAFELKPKKGWGWVLVSAIISIIAGALIATGLPGTSLFVIGIVVGFNFLSTGLSMIALSMKVGRS